MAEKKTLQSIKLKLRHLQGKHRELDKIIEHNEQDSSPDSWHILQNLKKKKLRLKDQIASVKSLLSRSEN